jgi:type II secretory pathway pseudopilin PulG
VILLMSQTTAQSRSTVVAADAGSVTQASQLPRHRRAYTLLEVLIVASIVVLMLGMALPVFRAITGSRSEAGAANIISSVLSRARADAIGLNRTMGVAFLYNPSTQQSYLAEVEFPDCPAWVASPSQPQNVSPLGYVSANNASNGYTYYYVNPGPGTVTLSSGAPTPPAQSPASGLNPVGGPPLEIRADTELLPLPSGIGVQTICNCFFTNTGARQTDGYLNFGVILFDGQGRIVGQNYGVSASSKLMTSSSLNTDYPTVGQSPPIYYGSQLGLQSQFGLVVFQREAFVSQNFPTNEPAYTTANINQASAYSTQQAEENWLDQNATPLLIDRYTGTLIKGD